MTKATCNVDDCEARHYSAGLCKGHWLHAQRHLPVDQRVALAREERERFRREVTTVYRMFDAEGVLLYVGISVHAPSRFHQHASDKPWWPLVRNVIVEHFATRGEAEAAELEAIQTEAPIHNIAGSLTRATAPRRPVKRAREAGPVRVVPGSLGYAKR